MGSLLEDYKEHTGSILEEYRKQLTNGESLTDEEILQRFKEDEKNFNKEVNDRVGEYKKLDMDAFIRRIGGQESIDAMNKIIMEATGDKTKKKTFTGFIDEIWKEAIANSDAQLKTAQKPSRKKKEDDKDE